MSAADLQLLYDFETPVESALALLLAQNGIAVFTPSNATILNAAFKLAHPDWVAFLPVTDLQQVRPRVELEVQMGAAGQRHWPVVKIPPVGGYSHDMAYDFMLVTHVITNPNIALHRQLATRLRALLATCLNDLNGFDPLTRHRIQELNFSGGSPGYKPEEDVFDSPMTWSGKITIQAEALAAALASP